MRLFQSVQLISRVQLSMTPWIAAHPGFPVLHCLLELAQTHVHQDGDTIQSFHRESIPSQADKKSKGPHEETGLEFSRRKKGQTFSPLYIP